MSDFQAAPWLQQELMIVDFSLTDYAEDNRQVTTEVSWANVVTSRVPDSGWPGVHRPVLDIDVPAALIPSSTPGHSHLYIDRKLSWPTYVKLLDALGQAGILEAGYVEASRERGHTAVRLPWVRK